jgi:hypothetical protein
LAAREYVRSKTHETNPLALKSLGRTILKTKETIFMEHLELTRAMFVTVFSYQHIAKERIPQPIEEDSSSAECDKREETCAKLRFL